MTPARPEAPGGSRVCPHCRQTILASAAVCPICRHHLRAGEATVALAAAGTICEYSIMVSVYAGDGTELTRQIVGVGALKPNETRVFDVSVEAREHSAPV